MHRSRCILSGGYQYTLSFGISLAVLSGICNGLFTAPMRMTPRWRWENIWLVFILTSYVVAGYTLAPPWGLSIGVGVLWDASIFLYGAATPLLGDLGPSIGWPLSLAMGLLTANLMGFVLREWRTAPGSAARTVAWGLTMLMAAFVPCAFSSKAGAS